MDFVRHIIGFIATLLFTVLGAVTMPMASTVSHQAEFFPPHAATAVEHTDVHFAARAPPTTAPNVAATGDVTVMHDGAFVARGVETQWASLNFDADLYAPKRGALVDDSFVPSGSAVVKDGTVQLNQNIVTRSGEVIPAGSVVTETGGAIKVVTPDGVTITGRTDNLLGSNQLTLPATNRTQLIDDLVAGGTRITPENVVDIRSINGRTIWLETGNSRAGLQHIVGEHGPEFAQRGITEAQIPDVVFTALQRNNVVGHQGRGTGRPIYEFDYGGQTHQLAITVGDNGFIVGANFR